MSPKPPLSARSHAVPNTHRPAASAWASALAQFHSSLFGFLLRRLRNMQTAEDLSQEVYLRLLRVEEPDRVRNPQAYMYRVAVNAIQEFKAREDNNPVGFDSELY